MEMFEIPGYLKYFFVIVSFLDFIIYEKQERKKKT